MTAVSEQIGVWLEAFTKQPKAEPWIQQLRDAAFARFAELGFPTTHDEEWRFTNVAPIARARFEVGPRQVLPSVPEDAQEFLAKHARFDKNPFVALNTAFFNGVHFTRVPRGTVLEQPIEVSFTARQGMALPHRTLIVVGAQAQCTIVETYQGTGSYFTNAVTEIVVGEGAVVDHYKIQEESREAFHIETVHATLGRSANFTSYSISIGGALVRNDANVTLSEGTEATLSGLYVVNGRQHVDNHTEIDHAKPHGTSHELYKGILDGKASAVFNGRIIVRKDAQKTDSKQTNKNLVLSDDAVIDTKPELQILADDVRCTHGATIGQLDAESLFYLQSRGIGKNEARDVLTYAFAQDIIDRVKVPALKDHLEKVLFEKFHERPE
ncbi:MAG TPA: Fe-S cluster assembly protein SufD [Bryobacteraceae bacterium]|nr:Fe-S cluster assembly protein SufD [Bryobacteraceae bacterium]